MIGAFLAAEQARAHIEYWGHVQLREHRARFLDEHRGAELDTFYNTMPPFFHEVWAGSFLDAQVPDLRTTDGEEIIATTVRFDVMNGEALVAALDGHSELEPGPADKGEVWRWTGPNPHDKPTSLGNITRDGDRLVLETHSVERAARGRALLEALGSELLRRVTSHESLRRTLKDRIRTRYLSGEADDNDAEAPGSALPPEVAEALVLSHYATYYRRWIDEPMGIHAPGLISHAPSLIPDHVNTRTSTRLHDLALLAENWIRPRRRDLPPGACPQRYSRAAP